MDEQLTITKAAKMFGVTYQTVRKWCIEGKVRTNKTPGGQRRIPLSEVERFQKASPENL